MPSDDNDLKNDKVHTHRPQARRRLPPDFLKYSYPTEAEMTRIWGYLETVEVKEVSKRCIANLLKYRAVRTRARLPRGASAAVLVPLFVGRSGDLYVLLSRRSDVLKAFAGDTALPGGKTDAQDQTVEDTARREAFEEIGLPQDRERMPLLCVMGPHLAKGEIIVTPVVVLILDHSLQPNLNSSEVTSIFSQPLASFLSSKPYLSGGRLADPNNSYHTFTDFSWSGGGTLRLHRFLTGRESEGVKPVFGLTAAILIKTATIGYGQAPDFEVQPSDAPTSAQQIAHALLTLPNPLRIACEREGIDAERAAARLLRPPVVASARRMIGWQRIGAVWKGLLESGNPADGTTRVGSRHTDSDTRNPSRGVRCVETITWAREQPNSGSGEDIGGLDADDKRQVYERREGTEQNDGGRKERSEGSWDAIADPVKLRTLLDDARDNEGETERVEGGQGKDGELEPQVLIALIPKEGPLDGIKTGGGVIKNEGGKVNDTKEKDQAIEKENKNVWTGFEETKKRIDKGGDGKHEPRKCDAKL